MRKLFYDVKIVVKDNDYSDETRIFKNEGFLIVSINNGKVEKIEGLLTRDYIIATLEENELVMKYYELDVDSGCLQEIFNIILEEDEEIPLNLRLASDSMFIDFYTTATIKDSDVKKYYKFLLEEFKQSSIYVRERWLPFSFITGNEKMKFKFTKILIYFS